MNRKVLVIGIGLQGKNTICELLKNDTIELAVAARKLENVENYLNKLGVADKVSAHVAHADNVSSVEDEEDPSEFIDDASEKSA